MNIEADEPRKMKTTEKSMEVLESVKKLNGATVTEIANELDLNKSSVYTHLATLEDHELVVKREKRYFLGMKLLKLGVAARSREDAYLQARSVIKEIADQTKERAHFIIEEHGKGVYLFEEMGDRGVSTGPQIGGEVPLHATASGKAIMAHMQRDKRDTILDSSSLEKFTDNTITDENTLREELKDVRGRGFAINEQEDMVGINAIGAPVKSPNGRIIGAISVAGPAKRLSKQKLESEYADILLGYANELELQFDHDDDSTGFPYNKE